MYQRGKTFQEWVHICMNIKYYEITKLLLQYVLNREVSGLFTEYGYLRIEK